MNNYRMKLDRLTNREMMVLKLIEKGYSNKAIADELQLAVNTIKGYNSRIYDKLQVSRRNDAVMKARKLELI